MIRALPPPLISTFNGEAEVSWTPDLVPPHRLLR